MTENDGVTSDWPKTRVQANGNAVIFVVERVMRSRTRERRKGRGSMLRWMKRKGRNRMMRKRDRI